MSKSIFYNLLTEPLIGANTIDGKNDYYSLPGVYSLLMQDKIVSFPHLRPHQRHAWHSFLCQLGAMAVEHRGLTKESDLPDSEDEWLKYIKFLTKDFTNDEPWALVVDDNNKPAFMQAPKSPVNKVVKTPDELDTVMVTAKNHDVKQHIAQEPKLNDWFFSLISLQTMSPFLGNGNYGIIRMNGGYSSRFGMGISYQDRGIGITVKHDITHMVRQIEKIANRHSYNGEGPKLLWLLDWNDDAQISLKDIHPYFIEICRRVRLYRNNLEIYAQKGTSKKRRVDSPKDLNGLTGDYWAPQNINNKLHKVISAKPSNFRYDRIAEMLFDKNHWSLPPSLENADEDGLELVMRCLVGGQGKTEGYFERVIPFHKNRPSYLFFDNREKCAELSNLYIEDIKKIIDTLKYSIALILCGGENPQKEAFVKANTYIGPLREFADSIFFEYLFKGIATIENNNEDTVRYEMLQDLVNYAHNILENMVSLPSKGAYRYRAIAKGQHVFNGRIYNEFPKLRQKSNQPTEANGE